MEAERVELCASVVKRDRRGRRFAKAEERARQERERGQSTHSNRISLDGGVEWDDLVERWLGR